MQEPLQFTYPYPAETVLAMFRDPGYITRKHAQLRQRNIRILEAIDKPGRYRLSVRRDARGLLPESVPEFAQKFLSGRLSGIITTIAPLQSGTFMHTVIAKIWKNGRMATTLVGG